MEEASTRQEPAVSVPPGPPVTGEVLPLEWQVIADNSEEKTNLVRFSDPETGEAVTGEEAKAYKHAKGMTNDELGDFTAPHFKDICDKAAKYKPYFATILYRFRHLKAGETVNGFTRADKWASKKVGKSLRSLQYLVYGREPTKLLAKGDGLTPQQHVAVDTLIGIYPNWRRKDTIDAVNGVVGEAGDGDINAIVKAVLAPYLKANGKVSEVVEPDLPTSDLIKETQVVPPQQTTAKVSGPAPQRHDPSIDTTAKLASHILEEDPVLSSAYDRIFMRGIGGNIPDRIAAGRMREFLTALARGRFPVRNFKVEVVITDKQSNTEVAPAVDAAKA